MTSSSGTWQWHQRPLGAGEIGAWLQRGDRRATLAELIDGWHDDAALRVLWTASLAAIPFGAYSWETPPMTAADTGRDFECVFVDNPELAATSADPAPFGEPFAREPGDDAAAVFANLGGDAQLIAPRPLAAAPAYAHLASFVRAAPREQVHDTWRIVAQTVREHVGGSSRWLSTAGLGVYWLHFRIDTRPKYYRHAAYQPAHHWTSIHDR